MRNRIAMKKWSACLLAVTAAACSGQSGNNQAANAAAPAPAAGAGAPATGAVVPTPPSSYFASGSDPLWALTISLGHMSYAPQGGQIVTEPLPAPTAIANGYRYQGSRLTADIVHAQCVNLTIAHPDTVRVTVDGRTVQGCGEAIGSRAGSAPAPAGGSSR